MSERDLLPSRGVICSATILETSGHFAGFASSSFSLRESPHLTISALWPGKLFVAFSTIWEIASLATDKGCKLVGLFKHASRLCNCRSAKWFALEKLVASDRFLATSALALKSIMMEKRASWICLLKASICWICCFSAVRLLAISSCQLCGIPFAFLICAIASSISPWIGRWLSTHPHFLSWSRTSCLWSEATKLAGS